MKALHGLAAAILASIPSAAMAEKLVWKPKAGTTLKFDYVLTARVTQAVQGPTFKELMIRSKVIESFTAVSSDGTATVEESTAPYRGSADGKDMSDDVVNDKQTASFKVKSTGEMIDFSSTFPEELRDRREDAAKDFRFPDKDVAVGGKWTIRTKADPENRTEDGEATFTLLGEETVHGLRCFKIRCAYRETHAVAGTAVTSSGIRWIDKATGELVKLVLSIKNAPTMFGTEDSDITMDRD